MQPRPSETHHPIYHFGQANPKGSGQEGDVPALLRRVADTLEGMPGAEVLDLVLHDDIAGGESWYSLVVYYSMPDEPEA